MYRMRRAKLAAALLAPALILAACADDADDTASPSVPAPTGSSAPGSPIKLMTLTSETGPIVFPEVVGAARAAAKAVNDAGGVNGSPIEILNCDTRFDPNGAADCARRAVSEKVTAVVGSVGPDGDTYVPILEAAGIPTVANLVSSQAEATSAISFPFHGTAIQLVTAAAVAKAEGKTSMQYLGPDVPAYVGLLEIVKQLLPTIGMEFKGSTLYPVTATDYTQYVASAYEADADAVNVVLISSQSVPAFVNAVDGGGYSFDDTLTTTFGTTFKPSVLEGPAANKLDGVYILNGGQTPTDTSLPAIKTFQDELAANGGGVEFNDTALAGWVGVHVIAEVLKTATGDLTAPATLIAALKAAGPINYPGWTPLDFSKPALPGALAEALPRFANNTVWVSKIVDNKAVSAVTAPQPFTGPVTLGTASTPAATAEATAEATPTATASTGSASSSASEATASPTATP
ncbi:MAG: ABC transporter substrate-binding protein [Sporichthyaceae bacterium]